MNVKGRHLGVPQGSVLDLLVQRINNPEKWLDSEGAIWWQ